MPFVIEVLRELEDFSVGLTSFKASGIFIIFERDFGILSVNLE